MIGNFVSRLRQDRICLDAVLGVSHEMAPTSGGSKTEKEAGEHLKHDT